MIYVLVAMGIALAISSGYGYIQHEQKLVAEAKVTVLETQIGRQNDAVAVTKADGDRRVAQATKGVAASAAVTQAAVAEAARLRALGDVPTPPVVVASNCPAGAAVGQIRKGLQ
jgi:hypothetical protein